MKIEQPTVVVRNGVPNLERVEGNLYRGGQIKSDEGWMYLDRLARLYAPSRKMTVIRLNRPDEGRDVLPDSVTADVLDFSLPGGVDDEVPRGWLPTVVRRIGQELSDGRLVYVHCQYGVDRTGEVIAAWRISRGWSLVDAMQEAFEHDMDDSFVEPIRAVQRFAQDLK